MSIMTCGCCDRYVDTDYAPMETLKIDGYEIEVCEVCIDRILEEGEDE